MIEHAVLGTSIVFQFVAAFLALYLIRVTGWRVAWSMIAGAMVLMGVRRSITFYHSILEGASTPPDLSAELVALTISVLMVLGAAKIAPIFESIRRNEGALRESEGRLSLAIEAVGLGIWSRTILDDRLLWDEHVEAIFGLEPGSFKGTMDAFLARVHPDDREAVLAGHKRALDKGVPYDIDYRIIRPDGSVRYITSRASAIGGSAGGRSQIIGALLDITERKQAEAALRESEERFRHYAEASADWFWEMDADLRFTYLSDNVERVAGYPPEWHYGKTRQEVLGDDYDREAWAAYLADMGAHKPFRSFEFSRADKNGEVNWFSTSGVPVFSNDGAFRGYRGIGSIITERKRSEAALQQFATAVENIDEIVTLYDGEDKLVFFNRAFRDINREVADSIALGMTFEELLRVLIPGGLVPEAEGREETWLQERLERHCNPPGPFEVARQDGIWLLTNEQHLPNGGNITISLDITERKRVEEALRTNEDRLQGILDNSPVAIVLKDIEGRYILANRHHQEIVGRPFDEYRGKLPQEAYPGSPGERVAARDREVLANREFVVGEEEFDLADGTHTFLTVKFPIFDGAGALINIGSVSTDITERKKVEAALRNSEQRLHTIIDQQRDAILVVDGDGLIHFANPAAERILGRKAEDLVGDQFGIPIVSEDIAEVEIPGCEVITAEMEVVPVDWDGVTSGLVSLRDITQRKHAEESAQQLRAQLTHAARLSTMGDLAAGLAHEINQPLSAISSYTQACLQTLRSGGAPKDGMIGNLEKVGQQVDRAANVVRWLRDSVKKERPRRTELDLNSCVREVASFLEWETRATKSSLIFELSDTLPSVTADKVQIQQVILNLLQNSLETVNGGKPRQITIRTLAPTDDTVRIEVSDDGPGIADDIAKDLFSPFFTTKSDGLGFGLSISNTIIEAHGGRIWIDPDAEDGVTFVFTLPVAREQAA